MDVVSYKFLQEEIEELSKCLENFARNLSVELVVLSDAGGRVVTFAPQLDTVKPFALRSSVISAAVNGALDYLDNFIDRGRHLFVSGTTKSVYLIIT